MSDAQRQHVRSRRAPALGHRASAGFAWFLTQSAILKGVGFCGQLVLAWLLKKEDFGVYALALLVATSVGLVHQSGLSGVLVSRGDRLSRWISPAFWLSLLTGALASAAMLAVAPVAAILFHNQKLTGLICVFALTPLFNAVSLIPQAVLQVSMRFRAISILGLLNGIGSTSLTVLLAALDFHAYSFVIPAVVFGAVNAGASWWLVRPRIEPKLQFRRWRLLLVDAGYVQGVAVMFLILGQADYFTLGCLKPAAIVGVYFFAFTLSMQPVTFLAGSLGSILLPVLSRLRSESMRQTQAFIRAARQLALVGAPLCLAQAILARPLLSLVFRHSWDDAIPVFQVLSIGAAFVFVGGPASALLQARGRFGTYFIFAAVCALFFLFAVQVGARLGGAVSTAVAVTIFYLVFGPLGVYVAIAPGGGRARDVLGIYLAPVVAGFIACGAPFFLVDHLLPIASKSGWPLLIATPLLGVPIYVAIVRVWRPSDWEELIVRLKELFARLANAGKATENVAVGEKFLQSDQTAAIIPAPIAGIVPMSSGGPPAMTL
ncbi:MAG TPA: oligosaccharide flippase family protein [Tepidisphaeraceae bacterium]|nr:oligosaccharide flippase family protein [Tepidisphaeraceae bacterium]